MKKKRFATIVYILPFALLVAAFELFPVITILNNSFMNSKGTGYGLDQYISVFSNKFYLQAAKNSLVLAFYSSIIGLTVAILGAYSIGKLGKSFRDSVLMLSNLTSNFAGVPLAFAFIVLLGQNGGITLLLNQIGQGYIKPFDLYSASGLVLVYAYFQIPLGILLMYPCYDGIKKEWMEAAGILGASGTSFWRHVGIPVLLPGILGTFSILFANSMGAYATAIALTSGNYNLLSVRIGSMVSGDMFMNIQLASALSVILGAVLIATLVINRLMLAKRRVKKL
jgi:putative spermidine/putrescine transport system permease protein